MADENEPQGTLEAGGLLATPEPTAAPAAASSASGADSPANYSDDWRQVLSEDMRQVSSIKDLKSADEVVKKLVNLEGKLGKGAVVPPTKDASPEERAAFFTAMGRPEAASKYQMPTEGMPEGHQADDGFRDEFFNFAFESGLSSTQVAEALRWWAHKQADGKVAERDAALKRGTDAEAELRKEFGSAFDERLGLARNAVREFGGEELVNFLESSGLGSHPQIVKAFAAAGKALGSDPIQGEGSRASFDTTPVEANLEIERLKADPNFQKRWTNSDPRIRATAVAELEALFKKKNPVNERTK